MANVQLSDSEKTVVYRDVDTKRILGFAPERAAVNFPVGTRYEAIVLNRALDIERWAKRFRAEEAEDREERTYKKVMKEAPQRRAIREALIERNKHVNNMNRDLNNALLAVMDQRYRRAIEDQKKVESFLLAEKHEANKTGEDLAMENVAMNLRK